MNIVALTRGSDFRHRQISVFRDSSGQSARGLALGTSNATKYIDHYTDRDSQFEQVAETNSSPHEGEAHGARHHSEPKEASIDNNLADGLEDDV